MSLVGLFVAIAFGTSQQSETCTLVANNRPIATIVIPSQDPELEVNMRAARLLQSSVQKMSGCMLPIVKSDKRNSNSTVNIGFPEKNKRPTFSFSGGEDQALKLNSTPGVTSHHPKLGPALKPDGFSVYTSGASLSIVSGGKKGSIYGVVHLLEKYFGCRCFSPAEYIFPEQSTLEVKNVFDIENPGVEFRAVNGDFSKDPDYLDWTKGNSSSEMYGAGYSVHTFEKLVPPSTWFKDHPDYYALIKNRRSAIQLCPSNPEIVPIVVAKLKQEIAAQPSKHVWSVSQNDNEYFCQCQRCLDINSEERTPGGAQLRFVNEIAKQFPKEIGRAHV